MLSKHHTYSEQNSNLSGSNNQDTIFATLANRHFVVKKSVENNCTHGGVVSYQQLYLHLWFVCIRHVNVTFIT